MSLLIALAVLIKYWYWVLLLVVLWYVAPIVRDGLNNYLLNRRIIKTCQKVNRQIDAASLAHRADVQNQEYLYFGVYEGDYAGYTMPLTRPTIPMNLDDYDDGLDTWKTR